VLKNVSAEMAGGKLHAIVGPSGSGKTTLLSIMAGMDRPSSGAVFINGEDLARMDLDRYRREKVSMVFQAFQLFPLLTAIENVCFPMEALGVPRKKAEERARILLGAVGIDGEKHYRYPANLSGGEQQRVAIARALSTGAKVILADEPTGNLDTANGEAVLSILQRLAHKQGYCVVIVTHNPEIADSADQVMRMKDGVLTTLAKATPQPPADSIENWINQSMVTTHQRPLNQLHLSQPPLNQPQAGQPPLGRPQTGRPNFNQPSRVQPAKEQNSKKNVLVLGLVLLLLIAGVASYFIVWPAINTIGERAPLGGYGAMPPGETMYNGGYPEYEPADTPSDTIEVYQPAQPVPEPISRTLFEPTHAEVLDFSGDAAATVEFVETVHPNFVVPDRMCMESYEAFREAYLAATANPMTHTEFTLATQRFLTVFQDGHISRTFLMGEWVFRNGDWEWETRLFQDGYFIDHLLLSRNGRLFLADDNFVITDTEVLAIGGVPVDDIFAVIDYHFGAYNYAGMQRARGRYARYQLMLQFAGASLYMCDDRLVTDITVIKDGTEYVMEMGFTPQHPSGYRSPSYEPEYSVRWEMMGDDVMYISLQGLLIDGEYVDEPAAAVEQAMADGVRKFILDLRNSRGGNPEVWTTLLSAMGATPPRQGHIIRIPDNLMEWIIESNEVPNIHYFRHLSPEDFIGQEYVYIPRDPGQGDNPYGVFVVALTSERTFSGATMIAVEIADSDFGMVIGEPSATAPTGCGWGQSIWLENSRLQIRPHYTFSLRPDADADQRTLWPDIHVYEWYALDAALEFLYSLNIALE